jgi:hypothetical protein
MTKAKSIYEVAAKCLVEAGRPVPFAPEDVIAEAMSSSDFPNVTAETMGRVMDQGYKYYPDNWRRVCKIRPVKDFRNIRVLRMTEFGDLQIVPGEKAEAIQFTQNAEVLAATYHANLYAIRVEHLWQLLLSDDIGAFTEMTQALGRAAYRTKLRAVFDVLNNGGTLTYDADGIAFFNNAAIGGGGHFNDPSLNLTRANLETCVGRLLAFTDNDAGGGNTLFISKFYLIVPPALSLTAGAIWKECGGSVVQGQVNLPSALLDIGWAGIIVTPGITSTTAWYVMADPKDISCIEVAELRGYEEPKLFTNRGHWNESFAGYNLDENFTSQHAAVQGYAAKGVNYRMIRGHA